MGNFRGLELQTRGGGAGVDWEPPVAALIAEEPSSGDAHAPPVAPPAPVQTASCYLYYDPSGLPVQGPRVVDMCDGDDPNAVNIESMTKSDFAAYKETRGNNPIAERFIENIRNIILTCNEGGGLWKNSISPAVLTDDWVVRATDFVQHLTSGASTNDSDDTVSATTASQAQSQRQRRTLKLTMKEKIRGGYLYAETWLVVRMSIPTVGRESGTAVRNAPDLPLAMFTNKKNGNRQLYAFLNVLVKRVREVLVDAFFPVYAEILPLEDAADLLLNSNNASNDHRRGYSPARIGGVEIDSTLKHFKELRKRGATDEEILAERARIRQARRQRRAKNDGTTVVTEVIGANSAHVDIKLMGADEESQVWANKSKHFEEEVNNNSKKSAVFSKSKQKHSSMKQLQISSGRCSHHHFMKLMVALVAIYYFVHLMNAAAKSFLKTYA